MSKYTIADMQEIAKYRGGTCLSDVYVNKRTKLLWKCAKGHQWEAIPDSVNRGSWCPVCAGGAELTIKDMHEAARKSGGKCLSGRYVNNKTNLLWGCAEGHQWEAPPQNIRRGTWCAICSGVSKRTIDEMQQIATERGGKCLSNTYVNNTTKLSWECDKGHQWEATPHDIKGTSWCPTCYGVFRLSLADMKKLARKNKGKCLSLDYINSSTKLLWECSKGHQWRATPNTINKGSWCPTCAGRPSLTIEDMRKIADENGGKCLSLIYVNNKTKLLWECANKHIWEDTLQTIKKGRWCQQCKDLELNSCAPRKDSSGKSWLLTSDLEVGCVCIKLKGKDAGKVCVVMDHIDERHVMVDGLTRRKKCRSTHLNKTDLKVNICKGASHNEVIAALASVIDIDDPLP